MCIETATSILFFFTSFVCVFLPFCVCVFGFVVAVVVVVVVVQGKKLCFMLYCLEY